MFNTIPERMASQANPEAHRSAMRGGDDTLSYTQSGEIVIPVEVQRRFPGLAEAAMAAIAQSGGNPAQFVAGSPQGNYHPQTGAQQFFLGDLVTNAADFVSNTRTGQALASGVAGYGLSKLAGADNRQAAATGIGAGLGYAAGDWVGDQGWLGGEPAAPDPEPVESASVGEALSNAAGSFSGAGIGGALLGGAAGYQLAPEPASTSIDFDPNAPSSLDDAPTSVAPDTNVAPELAGDANVSATVPTNVPVAPPTPEGLAARGSYGVPGVYGLRSVIDRRTGQPEMRRVDASPFRRAVEELSLRRAGFGNAMRL